MWLHRMHLKILYFVTSFLSTLTENVGWKSYLSENSMEFHDIPLVWEKGNSTSVPNWLTGIYARNGPAQVTILKTKIKTDSLWKRASGPLFLYVD